MMKRLKLVMSNLRNAALLIAGILITAFILWTMLASFLFLFSTGLLRDFQYPVYQWWWYYILDGSNPLIAKPLHQSAAVSSVVIAAALMGVMSQFRNRFGPSLHRLSSNKPRAAVRGSTDNHGHAKWLSMEKARALFPGPGQEYGGIVLGEAYRVDEDSVADMVFEPGKKESWGRGGKAALLVDPCKSGPTHSLVFAGAGSFKSTSAVSTLLTWTGSAVVLDPSCELGPMLENARRNMGHEVHQLSIADGLGFNVLDWINTESPVATTNVLSVVNWVCGDAASGQDQSSNFFASRGKALVSCLLAHMLWDPSIPDEHKTLRRLRAGLALPEADLRALLGSIHENSFSSLARDYAGTLKGLVDETFSGIYANADESTAWLANPAFAGLVSGDSFKTMDLMSGKVTVFLQISLGVLLTTPAVGRTVIGALLNSAYEADGKVNGRLLYLLDEVARLGPMKIIEVARDAGRKYGITLQLLYQSVGQLEKQWGKEGKREWYDGVSHRTYAAIQDLDTAKELEDSFGTFTAMSTSAGSNSGISAKGLEMGSKSTGSNVNYQEVSRPLIRKDELMNDCRTDEAFIVVRGAAPLRCGRAIYFRRPEFVRQVAANRFNKNAPQPAGAGV